MDVEERIVDLLKEADLDILESIEALRNIESAFLEHLKENIDSPSKQKASLGVEDES